jgi:hypothetical protein
MEREDADQLVDDDDRRRQHGATFQGAQRLTAPQRPVGELGRGFDVLERDRPALPHCEIRHRQRCGERTDRLDRFDMPLRGERHPVLL